MYFSRKEQAIDTQTPDLSRLKIDRKESTPSPHTKRGFHKIIWTGLGTLALLGVTGYYFIAVSTPHVEIATVISVNSTQPVTVLNASGYVVAQRRAAVASKGTGRLIELRVKEGDRVKKGQILAQLENADVTASLSRARANLSASQFSYDQVKAELNEATLNYKRKKELREAGLLPQAEFDTAEARYHRAQAAVATADAEIRGAEAAVKAAEVDLENTYIRAPFNGTVLTKNAEVGEVVAPFGSSSLAKAAVVTMADMESLQVEADVSESNISKITIGQPCEITLDAYPEAKYKGIVDTIVPTADRAKATVLTKIKFLDLDDRVLPEMSAKASFLSEPTANVDTRPVVATQPGAIVMRSDRKVVFVIQGDRVNEVPVEVGDSVGNLVEIKAGLKPGDRVVMNPQKELSHGDRVQIKQ
jgi:RND family efflux transporter MFP subunit